MSQYVYCYYGYGVDLGDLEFKPKFSKNKKVQKDCQTIFDKFLNDDDTLYDNDLDCSFEGTDYDDITLTWHPNSEAYNFLLIIENEYVVGPNVKTYTVKEAKEHLTKAFNYLFDNWNEAYAKENKTPAPANTEQAKTIKQAVDQTIIKNANYDVGKWYEIG